MMVSESMLQLQCYCYSVACPKKHGIMVSINNYFSPPVYRLYVEEVSVKYSVYILYMKLFGLELLCVAGLTTRWQFNTFLHEKSCSKYFMILVMHYHPTQNAVHFSFSGCCSETGPSWSTAGAERHYRHSSGPLVVCQRCHRVQTHLVIIR